MKKIFLVLAMFLLALPAGAMAAFEAGDKEFTLTGTGTSDDEFDNNFFTTQFAVGYFFNDMLEGIFRQDLSFLVRDEDDDDWEGSTAVGVDFNFNLNGIVPFLGATVGYAYGDVIEETWFLGPEAGAKFFVNTTTFIQALVQYQWLFDNGDEVTDNFDDGRYVYGLGIGFKF